MTFNEPFRAALAGLFVLVLLGSFVELWAAARRARPPLFAVLATLGLTAFAALFYAFVSPWTHLHEYYHVTEHIESALRSHRFELYGETGPALYRFANALFGGEERAIHAMNAFCAALAVPAVVFLDLALFRRWPRALFAGLLLACLPLHAKFAASESTFVPALFLSVVGLAHVAWYTRSGRGLALATGVVALALAAQARPEAIMLILVAPLLPFFVLPARDAARRVFSWPTLGGVLLLALLLVPRALTFLEKESTGGHVPEGLRAELLTHQVLWDPLRTPEALWVFLALAAAWSLWRRERATLFVVLAGEACLLFSLWFFDTPVSNARTHLLGMPYFCVAAAGGAALLLELAARSRALVAAAALVLVAAPAHGLWQRYDYVVEELDLQLEWRFLEETIPKLPSAPGLAILAVTRHVGKYYLGAFPAFLLERAGKSATLLDLHDVNTKSAFPAPRPGLLFYQGMYCYMAYADEPAPSPWSERCRRVRERYELRPLLVTTLHTKGYSPAVYPPPPYEIGFFEIAGVKQPSL